MLQESKTHSINHLFLKAYLLVTCMDGEMLGLKEMVIAVVFLNFNQSVLRINCSCI